MTDDYIRQRQKELGRLEIQLRQAQTQAHKLGMHNYVEVLEQIIEPLALLRARGVRLY